MRGPPERLCYLDNTPRYRLTVTWPGCRPRDRCLRGQAPRLCRRRRPADTRPTESGRYWRFGARLAIRDQTGAGPGVVFMVRTGELVAGSGPRLAAEAGRHSHGQRGSGYSRTRRPGDGRVAPGSLTWQTPRAGDH